MRNIVILATLIVALFASPAFAGDICSLTDEEAAATLAACPDSVQVAQHEPHLSIGQIDIDLFAAAKTWLSRYIDGLGYKVDGAVTEGTVGARWEGWRFETTRYHSWKRSRGVEQDITLAKGWSVEGLDLSLSMNHYNFGRLRDLWKGDIMSPELEIARRFEFRWGAVTPSLLGADLISVPNGEHRPIGRAKLDFAIPLGDRGTLAFAPIVRRDGGNSQANEGWLFSAEASLGLAFDWGRSRSADGTSPRAKESTTERRA